MFNNNKYLYNTLAYTTQSDLNDMFIYYYVIGDTMLSYFKEKRYINIYYTHQILYPTTNLESHLKNPIMFLTLQKSALERVTTPRSKFMHAYLCHLIIHYANVTFLFSA